MSFIELFFQKKGEDLPPRFPPKIIRLEYPTVDGGPGSSPMAQRKLVEAFEVFDHEQNRTVDRREVGAILRSLGEVLANVQCVFLKFAWHWPMQSST